MTQTLGTTPDTNDIFIAASGNLEILQGQDAVEAACATASKLQLGEAVLQTGLGLPNFQVVWVGNPNIAIFQQYLRNALLNVKGVVKITSLTTKVANGVLSYTAEIESAFGNTATIRGVINV